MGSNITSCCCIKQEAKEANQSQSPMAESNIIIEKLKNLDYALVRKNLSRAI